ncbi:long-chain-fatty-acid--CoA ligase FadD [Arenicella sp. 4NH20-0111]|uniref:AMP-binding protein n=1 Tax=Arenicella sp. 4NH20-0111 TaxID=3127648 RepID=UPI003104067B
MEPVWLNSYPKGVPHDVDMSEFSSVADVFLQSCKEHASMPAYTSFDHTITFGKLELLTQQFACYLQHDLGLKKGDRIAIMLPNIIQYPIAVLSAMRLGLIIVNIDPMYTQRELKIQFNDSGAKSVIVLESFAKEVEKALADVQIDNVIVSKIGDCLPSLKALSVNLAAKHLKKAVPSYSLPQAHSFKSALTKYQGDTGSLKDATLTHEDLLFLQYTGGTTGVPKGVEITHGNMVANIQMSKEWIKPSLAPGVHHRIIAPLPMYHIFCMSVNLMVMMSLGAENILIVNPRDFDGFVKILRKNRFTGITAVNTLLRKLLDTPGFESVDFSELDFTFAGGMAVTRDVANEWHEKTGCAVVEAYGLSECSPGVSSVPITSTKFMGSIGLPLPSTKIKLLDDDGNEVGFNESGELCVAGPQVMRGYWNRPDATAEVMTEDGFLRTGDYVSVDEQGYIRVLDRKKDMILVSGFNVFPNEIEDVVNQHDNIVESAAIGIEDRNAGQVVKLFVVTNDESTTKDEIAKHCKEHLTGYKRPKVIEFMDELPKSNVGKILRKELR